MKRVLHILMFALLAAVPAQASWIGEQLRSYSYEVGVSIPTAEIKVEGQDAAGLPLSGVQVGNFLPRPAFSVTTPPNFFSDVGTDYNFIFSFVWSNLDKQEIDGSPQAVGTSSDAYSVYIMPTLGYTFGTRQFVRGKGRSLRFALGVGAGWLLAKGDVLMTLTKPTPADLRQEFNFNKPTVAATFLTDLRWNSFGLRFMIDGPNLEDEGFRYQFLNLALRASYFYSPSDFMEVDEKDLSRRKGKKKNSRWTGDLVGMAGGRTAPIAGSSSFVEPGEKTTMAAGGGLLLHIKKEHWPLGIVIDGGHYVAQAVSSTTQFFDPQAVSKTASIEGQTSVINLGFRNTWRSDKSWQPFVGGGFTTFFSSVEGSLDNTAVSDNTVSFGFYLGAGLNFVFRKHYTIGIEGRMFNGTTELLGTREDLQGGQTSFLAGWHF